MPHWIASRSTASVSSLVHACGAHASSPASNRAPPLAHDSKRISGNRVVSREYSSYKPEHVPVEELALALGRDRRRPRVGQEAVPVPLHVVDRRAREDVADGRREVVDDGGLGEVEHELVARLSVRRRPGTPIAHSGCARNRSLSGLTISGSIHSPNFRPRPCDVVAPARRGRAGSLRGFDDPVAQSAVSSSRAPNQPSSSTNSSTPSPAASRAIATSRSWSKSKYVALPVVEQDRAVRVPPRARARAGSGTARGARRDTPPSPASDQARTASGVRNVCARLEPPRERLRVDPEPQPRGPERVHVHLAQVSCPSRRARRPTPRRSPRWSSPPERKERVVLRARAAAQAAHRLAAGDQRPLDDVALARPDARELDERPRGVGQVERRAHRAAHRHGRAALVGDAHRPRDDRPAREQRVARA